MTPADWWSKRPWAHGQSVPATWYICGLSQDPDGVEGLG